MKYSNQTTVLLGNLAFNSDGTYQFNPENDFQSLTAGTETILSFE